MDLTSVIGLIGGLGLVALGYAIDGGNVASLWMLSAMIIVLGGTFGSLCLSVGFNNLRNFPKLFIEVFIKPKSTLGKTIEYLVELSQTAKQNGLLSLEKSVSSNDPKKQIDPFLKKGILSVVDGIDPEKINDILQNEIYVYEQNRNVEISMFDSCAAYAPAFGMIGTIIGLIQMLAAGMEDPSQLTKAIGVAFITTLYGSLFANCLFIPSAAKLRSRMTLYRAEKEMIIDAVCAIRNGINPKMLQEQLSSYLILDPKAKTKSTKPVKKATADKSGK